MNPGLLDRRRSTDAAPGAASTMPTSAELRRRVYFWATVLGACVLVITWATQIGRPDPDLFVLYGNPVLLLQCAWLVWWLLSGRPLRPAEQVVLVVNTLGILVQLLLALVGGQAHLIDLTGSAYWTLVALSILSFLIFNNRQALTFTAGFYLLSVALPWSVLLARGGGLSGYGELLRVQLVCGAVLVLLSVLAWYRESFVAERGQRLSLEHLANTDPLTQIPNRRALYPEIERLLTETHTRPGGCLILLDIDHFKRVNDTFGHNVGDEVLIRMATLLRAELRDGDTVGRWGGEEFLLTLPGLPLDLGEKVAGRLRRRVEEQLGVPPITASFGVTLCTPSDDLQSCTARADRALYAAKASGRNRVVCAPEERPAPAPEEAVPLALNVTAEPG